LNLPPANRHEQNIEDNKTLTDLKDLYNATQTLIKLKHEFTPIAIDDKPKDQPTLVLDKFTVKGLRAIDIALTETLCDSAKTFLHNQLDKLVANLSDDHEQIVQKFNDAKESINSNSAAYRQFAMLYGAFHAGGLIVASNIKPGWFGMGAALGLAALDVLVMGLVNYQHSSNHKPVLNVHTRLEKKLDHMEARYIVGDTLTNEDANKTNVSVNTRLVAREQGLLHSYNVGGIVLLVASGLVAAAKGYVAGQGEDDITTLTCKA